MDYISNAARIVARDVYLAAKPHFGVMILALFCLGIFAFVHSMYAKNWRDSLRELVHEMNAASTFRRDPSALNFLFAVFLLISAGLVILGAEASHYIRMFFFKESFGESIWDEPIVIGILFWLFLSVFFVWSISFTSKFRPGS